MTRPAVLFDLDGTLVDSLALILGAYRHTMRTHRGRELDDALWLRGLGRPLRAQLRELANDEREVAAMLATYRDYYGEHHDRVLVAYPGAVAALRALHEGGARVALVTSKMRDNTMRALTSCAMVDCFDVIITADDVPRHKPDPYPVRAALEELSAAPEHALFIGDSPHDMAAGRAAGVAIGAVRWGAFAHDQLATFDPDLWLTRTDEIASLGTFKRPELCARRSG